MNPEISLALSRSTPKTHNEVSERAREIIVRHFKDRGRFSQLQEDSGISSAQWRNFYYGRQRVNEKMLAFVIEKFPDAKSWVLAGKGITNKKSSRPFGIPEPTNSECKTIGQRLKWVICEGKAIAKSPALLQDLAEQSAYDGHSISAKDWAKVIQEDAPPTATMIATICNRKRHFTLWILCGPFPVYDQFGPLGFNDQFDPCNPDAVSSFEYWQEISADDGNELEEIPLPASALTLNSPPLAKVSRTTKKNGNKKS